MAFLKFSRLLSLAALVGGTPLIVVSQATQEDSLKAVVAGQRALMVQADSTGQLQTAFDARIHLASLARKPEAEVLLKQAAALADSLDRPDLGAMARRILARRYARSGQHAAAYAESVLADSLQAVGDQREAAHWEDHHAKELQSMAMERDSLVQLGAERERRMAQAIVDLGERADAWMYAAFAALITGLLLVIGLLYRMGHVGKKRRAEIDELKVKLAQQQQPDPSGIRPSNLGKPICTLPFPGASNPVQDAVDLAMRPVAKGMFSKDAPERLSTLQDARKRGDNEKLLRVVATLRPYLLGVDAERFSPLIARLKAPGAADKAELWNADLDTLEAALRELLPGRADH